MMPARSRFAAALCAAGFGMATLPAFAAPVDEDTAAVIQDLKRRIEALEQQLSAKAAQPAPEVAAPVAAAPVAPVVAAAPAPAAATNGGDFKLA